MVGIELLTHVAIVMHMHSRLSWGRTWSTGTLLEVEWQLMLVWYLLVVLTRRYHGWDSTLLLEDLCIRHAHSRGLRLVIFWLSPNWKSIESWLNAPEAVPGLACWWLLRDNTLHDIHRLLGRLLLL